MAISKWTIFEYEYSVVEFIISFIVAFLLCYYLLISLSTISFSYNVEISAVFALIIGILWTYIRAHGLFTKSKKSSP